MDAPVAEAETFFWKKGPDALMGDSEDDGRTEELISELLASKEWAQFELLRKDVLDRIQ